MRRRGDKENEMAIESWKIVKATRKGFLGQNELAESLHALTFFCCLPNTLNFHCEPRSRWSTHNSTDIETVQGKDVSTHRVGWLGAELVEPASWLCSLGPLGFPSLSHQALLALDLLAQRAVT